jgi:hypothetical protein
VTRILREYRRERAHHVITTMCGALATLAYATAWVRAGLCEAEVVLAPDATEGTLLAGYLKWAGVKWTY